ncbi:hypothetical protein N8H74_20015 [Pseudomonas sp. B2M1-30]|uniref:hypothetical protein n=1 Tax=Pseudomonas TaxID=286 RepID=UPI0021CA7684|nr:MULTISPECIES: hypothetical protein [Pseudomonas]MCU0120554.1 hypothetical protein [Pseudomonas sp. B2M1-30]MCU7262572.1 hypothetical protein [Pseudomonas koreensis]
MKDLKTLSITPVDILKKQFFSHEMQEMTEYYSKATIGGCGRYSSIRQEFFPELLECLPCKNSILKK